MIARVTRSTVLIGLVVLTLTGCDRQVSVEPPTDLDRWATSPDPGSLPVPRPWVATAIDATGGLDDWLAVKKLVFEAVVTAFGPDGSSYFTEHTFEIYPWSGAIRITADEPQGRFVWQVVGGQYRLLEGGNTAAVSPLRDVYREYAEAVLQITTAPVRMIDRSVSVSRRPTPLQIGGQWYDALEAKFHPRPAGTKEEGPDAVVSADPYWTKGTYFQNQDRLITDVIWLSKPAAQDHIAVRGYDYVPMGPGDVLIPTKIEVFESSPEAGMERRLVLVDVTQ